MTELQKAIKWLEEMEKQNRLWEQIFYLKKPESSEYGDNAANCRILLDALRWIPVSDRLPEKPEYDWVLVHITLSPDGFVGLPHVAELRRGKWFSTEYDLPIEQILQGTVTHWMPLPEPPESEG